MPQNFETINLPGLDFEKGLDFFEGDTDDYIAALNSFVKNTPATINKLRGAAEENLSDYAINIHGLKSISAWICAEKIREGAEELDAMAKARNFSAISAKNEKFLDDADAFVNSLKTFLENNKNG